MQEAAFYTHLSRQIAVAIGLLAQVRADGGGSFGTEHACNALVIIVNALHKTELRFGKLSERDSAEIGRQAGPRRYVAVREWGLGVRRTRPFLGEQYGSRRTGDQFDFMYIPWSADPLSADDRRFRRASGIGRKHGRLRYFDRRQSVYRDPPVRRRPGLGRQF